MRNGIILKIFLMLFTFYGAMAFAATGAGAVPVLTKAGSSGEKYSTPSTAHRFSKAIARRDLKTDKPLLFKIGNLYVLGTRHNLSARIFSNQVLRFLTAMRSNVHLVEHNNSVGVEEIDGVPSTPEESIEPYLEDIKKALPEDMRESLQFILRFACAGGPSSVKPWAALTLASFMSKKASQNIYKPDGMDRVLVSYTKTLSLETMKEMFDSMGLSKMTVPELLKVFSDDSLWDEDERHSGYVSGDLWVLERELGEELKSHSVGRKILHSANAMNSRNIIFAKSTLKYLSEGGKDEVFFASMGYYHLLGEYGYLNLMSALLGKPVLRFDDKTGTFVPGETYLDAFAPKHGEFLEALKAQGIMPVA